MFDAETTRLIEGALPFEGIDLADLPQRLTEDYAKVVSIRMQAANPETDQQNDEWISLLRGLRDLAETYEAIAIFLPEEDPHRASCAFVAGSAYHILTQARELRARQTSATDKVVSLSTHGVSPEVAACLLFLIGGQQADAAEASKLFTPPSAIEAARLLKGLAALASGRGEDLRLFAITATPKADDEPAGDIFDQASASL